MLDRLAVCAMTRLWKMQEGFKNFCKEERGDHLVEIILVLVVVVGLAVIFRDNIAELVGNLWDSITGTTDSFNPGSVQDTSGGG